MFAWYASLRKHEKKWEQYCLRVIRAISPFPSAVLMLGDWEFMGLYWGYTSFLSFAPHIRARNGFDVLLHNLIHQLFLFSILEAFSSLSSLITEHSWCSIVSLVSVYSPQRIRQIDSHGEGDSQGYFLQGSKGRQCTYNIILRSFCATIVEVEKQKILHVYTCVCRLRYPVCNAGVLFCNLGPIRFNNTFPLHPIKDKIFYMLLNITCTIWFSLQVWSE